MKYKIRPTELMPHVPNAVSPYDQQQIFNRAVIGIIEKIFKGTSSDFGNLKLPKLVPADPEIGDVYFDTALNRIYVYNGTWKYIGLS